MQAGERSKSVSEPYQLSLRIRHPSMDPADLSRDLRLKAEHSFRAGDRRRSKSGTVPTSVYAESYWLGALDPAEWTTDVSFPDHPGLQSAFERVAANASQSLGWALSMSAARFFRSHADLMRRIGSEGGQVSLLISVSPTEVDGFTLAPELARIFSDLGVTLEFEFADN